MKKYVNNQTINKIEILILLINKYNVNLNFSINSKNSNQYLL